MNIGNGGSNSGSSAQSLVTRMRSNTSGSHSDSTSLMRTTSNVADTQSSCCPSLALKVILWAI